MAPELVAGGGYGGLFREQPYCAMVQNGRPQINYLRFWPSANYGQLADI